MTDVVNHPSHYAEGWSNGAEVIDITENLNFNRGNAVKYIARAGKKDPDTELEDLKKAEFYLRREICRLSPDPIITALDFGNVGVISVDDSFFIEHMSQPVQPRVWESYGSIPEGVLTKEDGTHGNMYARVTEGVLWVSNWPDGDGWVTASVGRNRPFGPFVEVVE